MPPKRKQNYAKPAAKKRKLQNATGGMDAEIHYPGSKRKREFLEDQFEFGSIPNWKNAKSQKVYGRDFIIHEPINKVDSQPTQIDFDLKDKDEIWGMGFNTRFKVRGVFQKKAATANAEWVNCVADDEKEVVVIPNLIDHSIKSIEVFNGNMIVKSSDESRYVGSYLSTWKKHYMDPFQKKLLYLQSCSPDLGTPTVTGDKGWSLAAGSEWEKFSKELFTGEPISFDYIPLDVFPFFQGCNYMENPQKILPMPVFNKLSVRLLFHENLSYLFKKKAGVTTSYRFKFLDFNLCVEHLRLSDSFQKSLLEKKTFHYPGVSRVLKNVENIVAGNATHQAKIQNIPMPEGLFIFAIPKDVVIGTFKYQDNTAGTVFEQHNIDNLLIKYGEHQFYVNSPNIGDVSNSIIESKMFFDYLFSPPFGMNMDPDKILLKDVKDGWKSTPYPHIYINLCNLGDKTRLIPINKENAGIIAKDHDMDITFTFGPNGATTNVNYLIYAFYTNHYISLDIVQKHPYITSPYVVG